ncbi:zinc finger protein 40-like [Nematolebias whitei]|uniref:zinc finger protein 40-like n=1 Tax=Nematolebias whitei TaxID=451745 RepID=UPI00189A7E29|nr:zinc finger protein 40-like [Nematolebias whitei]
MGAERMLSHPGSSHVCDHNTPPSRDFIDQQTDVQKLVEKVDIDAAHDKAKESSGRHDGGSRSTDGNAHTDDEDSPKGGQLIELASNSSLMHLSMDGTKKSSTSVKRALFAHRCLNASASTSPQSMSSIPHQELSPLYPSPILSCSLAKPLFSSSSSGSTTAQTAKPLLKVPTPGQSLGLDSSGPSCSPADQSVQSQVCPPVKDQLSAEKLSVSDVGLVHINPHPTWPQGSKSLLSHLPLHSQPPSRIPNSLISIGGIHMIQPRSTLPLYSLVGRQTAPGADPFNGKLTVPYQQKSPKEAVLPNSCACSQSSEASGQEG